VNFFCFDVETANESASSICQIGIAAFIEGRHEPKFDIEMYVDPEDYLRVMSENDFQLILKN
jgi:hypothetical protein